MMLLRCSARLAARSRLAYQGRSLPCAATTIQHALSGSSSSLLQPGWTSCSSSSINSVPSFRGLLTGCATPEATREYAERHKKQQAAQDAAHGLFLEVPATGWTVSRGGFGGDDPGLILSERFRTAAWAVSSHGCNVMHFDLDAVVARSDDGEGDGDDDGDGAASARAGPTHDATRQWEGNVLQRLCEQKKVTREELVLVGRLAMPPGIDLHKIAEYIEDRVDAALDTMDVECLDVLVVEVPADVTQFGATHMTTLLGALEAECADEDDGGGQGEEGEQEGEESDSEAVPRAQFFGIACSRFQVGDGTGAMGAAPAQPLGPLVTPLTPLPHLLGIEYPLNAFDDWALVQHPVPTALSTPPELASVASTVAAAGMLQMVRKPFDMMLHGRPFRCVAQQGKQDSQKEAGGPSGTTKDEPKDAATLLDELTEAVNTVVHLEQSFDKVVEAAMSYDPSSEDGKGDGSGDVDGDDVKTLLGDKSAPKPLAQAPAAEDTSWGLAIASNLERFDSLIEWQHVFGSKVWPAVSRIVFALGSVPVSKEWAGAYKVSMFTLNVKMASILRIRHSALCEDVSAQLEAAAPHLDKTFGLARGPLHLHRRIQGLLLSAGVDIVLSEDPDAFPLVEPAQLVAPTTVVPILDTTAAALMRDQK